MLHSSRLHLRALEPSDADFLYEVENDAEAWRYSDTVAPLSRKVLREYALTYDADPFSAGQLRLLIVEEDSNTPVGVIDLYEVSQRHLRAFIGIYICKGQRGKGYAEEAIRLVAGYAHNTLHLHQLGAKIEEGHPISEKLFTDLGFTCRGRLEEWISTPDGKYSDMLLFTKLLKAE